MTPIASAAVTTSYPAHACTFWKSGQLLSSSIYDFSRILVNNSGVQAVCPLDQHGGAATGSQIVVRDISTTQGFRCTLYTTDAQLGILTFSATSTTSAADYGTFVLNVGATSVATFASKGTKYIRCTVPDITGPDGSSLLSYSVTET